MTGKGSLKIAAHSSEYGRTQSESVTEQSKQGNSSIGIAGKWTRSMDDGPMIRDRECFANMNSRDSMKPIDGSYDSVRTRQVKLNKRHGRLKRSHTGLKKKGHAQSR